VSRFLSQKLIISSTFSSSLVEFECANLKAGKNDTKKPAKVKAVETFYEKNSGSNKRSYLKPVSGPQPQQLQQPQQSFQFQTVTDDRIKKKGQKRVEKRTEPQPLVEMFNDIIERYDFLISIKEMLQRNKVDISWMNLIIWSSAVCRKLKRLCTHIVKKKKSKAKQSSQTQQESSNLKSQFALTFDFNYDDQMSQML